MLYTLQDIIFSAALAVYIASSVFVSAVRFGHRCEPYAKHMDFYHPAWKTVVYCFLTNLLLLPAVFLPEDADALMAFRLMIMLESPYFCAMFLFTYFSSMIKMRNWKVSLYLLSFPFAALMISVLALAVIPGTQLIDLWARQVGFVCGMMAVIFLHSFAVALFMISKARRRISEENYSNPEDFPKQFALQAIWLSGSHVVISWGISLVGTKEVMAAGLLLLSVIVIVFLIIILSPHRALDVNRIEAEKKAREATVEVSQEVWEAPEVEEDEVDENLSVSRKEEILQIIRHSVEEEKSYLDSHLTLAALSRNCGVNRTYVSAVMNEYLGGFFAYVNRCRLAYAAAYLSKNPTAPMEEVATASGFGSRQSFYNARKQLEK